MYNAKEYTESKNATPGTVIEGAIINIADGKAKDFLKTEEAKSKWKNLEGNAINLVIEAKNAEGQTFHVERIFGYLNDAAGKLTLKQTSNLGKYKKFYSKLPEVGDMVKLVSNAEGFYKLML